MQRLFATACLLLAFALTAHGQARLRMGDPVQLTIGGVPNEEQQQINNIYTIDSSGSINLPFINKVKADGMTPGELASNIENSYRSAKIYTNPTITITMGATAGTARFVTVGGAVRNASRVPFTEDLTLLSAINGAGGFNDFADQRKVRVLRGTSVQIYDVREARRDPSKDIKLQPGDRVEVPQSFF